jgi:hypothetical protein
MSARDFPCFWLTFLKTVAVGAFLVPLLFIFSAICSDGAVFVAHLNKTA